MLWRAAKDCIALLLVGEDAMIALFVCTMSSRGGDVVLWQSFRGEAQ